MFNSKLLNVQRVPFKMFQCRVRQDYINKTKAAKVIMACRSKEKCEEAMKKLGRPQGWGECTSDDL